MTNRQTDRRIKQMQFFKMCPISERKAARQTVRQKGRHSERQTDGRDQFFFKMMDSQKNASKLKLRYL
jgi:hypothetical protein